MREFESERKRKSSSWIKESVATRIVRKRFVVHHRGFDAAVDVAETRGFSGRIKSNTETEYERVLFRIERVPVVYQILRFKQR